MLSGINKVEITKIPVYFAVSKKPNKSKLQLSTYEKIKNFLRKSKAFNHYFVNYISRFYRKDYKNYIRFLCDVVNYLPNNDVFDQIDLKKARTIHVYTVDEVIKVKNLLLE